MRASVIQTDPQPGNVERNLADCLTILEHEAAAGTQLLVFPECALSGYMLDEPTARACAEPIPGPSTDALARACARTGVHCVIGVLERDGDLLRNTAMLVGPDGLVGRYRKTHIACIGADRFTVPGDDPYEVFDTPLGRIGCRSATTGAFPR